MAKNSLYGEGHGYIIPNLDGGWNHKASAVPTQRT